MYYFSDGGFLDRNIPVSSPHISLSTKGIAFADEDENSQTDVRTNVLSKLWHHLKLLLHFRTELCQFVWNQMAKENLGLM